MSNTHAFDAAAALQLGQEVLTQEAGALTHLASTLGSEFTDAVSRILSCKGRLIVSGVGKSGHIGRKLAATFASTGTPAYFVHAAEAAHGDLGMITADDVVLAISYSGETNELLTIVPTLKREGATLIAITATRTPASPSTPMCISTATSAAKPARSIWRRPRPRPQRSPSATRSPLRPSPPRASRRRTSRAAIRAEPSAAACSSTFRTSCVRARTFPPSARRSVCLRRSRRNHEEAHRHDRRRRRQGRVTASSPKATCAASSSVSATSVRAS